MGLFNDIKEIFLGKEPVSGEEDYFKIAKDFEDKLMYNEAIKEYEKLIIDIYSGKDSSKYIHITKKLVELHSKLGNYDAIIELWPRQYTQEEYGAKQKLGLALLLEKVGKINEAMNIYENEEGKLQLQKVEFLMRQKRIDDANKECTRLLLSMRANDPGIIDIWMLKGKILMSIRRWEEAEGYFIKILERQNSNLEAKKLKSFCTNQLRKY